MLICLQSKFSQTLIFLQKQDLDWNKNTSPTKPWKVDVSARLKRSFKSRKKYFFLKENFVDIDKKESYIFNIQLMMLQNMLFYQSHLKHKTHFIFKETWRQKVRMDSFFGNEIWTLEFGTCPKRSSMPNVKSENFEHLLTKPEVV